MAIVCVSTCLCALQDWGNFTLVMGKKRQKNRFYVSSDSATSKALWYSSMMIQQTIVYLLLNFVKVLGRDSEVHIFMSEFLYTPSKCSRLYPLEKKHVDLFQRFQPHGRG